MKAKYWGSLSVCIVVLVIFCGLWYVIYPSTPMAHDKLLLKLSSSLASISHPAATSHVKSVQAVGLFANGDHCDYFAAEIRTYAGSKHQIQNFYSKVKLWNPLNHTWQAVELVFYQQGQQHISEYLPDEYNLIRNWGLPQSSLKQPLYVVYFLDSGYETGCDFRCL